MRKPYFFCCLFFFTISFSAFSQSDSECEQTLTHAQDEFNAGHFYGLPAILKDCLPKFSTEQRVRAYLLLAQSYLLVDDPIAAEDSYLKLLSADPEYVADVSKDPIDVFYLSKKFTTTPIFTPHVRIGSNISIYRMIYKENTFSEPVKTEHMLKPGIQVGGGLDWNINENLSLCGEVNYARKLFEIKYSGNFGQDDLSYTEKQNWVDVPVYIKYADSEGKMRPFGYLGYSVNLLFGPAAKLVYTNKTTVVKDGQTSLAQESTQGPDIKVGYMREVFNHSLVIGGGFRYKVGKDFILVDARYMVGFTNLTKAETNFYESSKIAGNDYTLSEAATKYAFVGDYFRLDNISLSIGYVRPLYHPAKLKKMRTGKTMRKVSKGKKNDE